ncbi:MAG: threonylcarbamoyl-AMP synthase [Clostridiales bacterium]|nr:threonylcarbamoyl-AMP synthase [Clostridiales bacterium]
MNTLILNENQIDIAAKIIKNGGLVAMPTETVYGLAANALDGEAVSKIYAAKGRPSDNPLIVHVASVEDIYPLVTEFCDKAKKLIESFCPGPLTIVFPKSDVIPKEISGGLDTVAIRFPSNEIACKLIRAAGVPLAAPSANISGSPSPTACEHVKRDLFGKIDAIIDGGRCSVGVESTVITLANPEKPVLLRPGGITLEMLQSVIGNVEVDPAVLNPLAKTAKAASPGMKYKHYSPKAKVILVKGNDKAFYDFVNSQNKDDCAALCYDEDTEHITVPYVTYGSKSNYETQAKKLFTALRRIDDRGFKTVYGRCPETDGIGLAVYNRLIRAAGFEVIEL